MPDSPLSLMKAASLATGKSAVGTRRSNGGHTAALRGPVDLADGTSVFVKVAADEQTAQWLRAEHNVYSQVHAPFMPKMLGWIESDFPALVLEDLSSLRQPPPWTSHDITLAQGALDQLARAAPPSGLKQLSGERQRMMDRWEWAVSNPEKVAALNLCAEDALPAQLAQMRDRASQARLEGQALVHLDVRADNMFFADDYALILDWNWAVIGNPLMDRVLWAIRAHDQGAPDPHLLVPGDAAKYMAAMVAGMWIQSLSSSPDASDARKALQLGCLRSAWDWANQSSS